MVSFTQSEAAKGFRAGILNIKGMIAAPRAAAHRRRSSHLALKLQMAASTLSLQKRPTLRFSYLA